MYVFVQCLSCAFLRNWLTKLTYFTKNWLSSYCLCWQYSLSFPCDTLVLCMNTVWLKVNPVRELRESCPVRFWEIGLQSWQISQNNWLSSYVSCLRYSLSFPCDTLVLCMNTVWLKVNPVRELRESSLDKNIRFHHPGTVGMYRKCIKLS